MANQEHLNILKQGIDIWNTWRALHPDVRPDFRGADLRGANLRRANLIAADLRGANLGDADLSQAYITAARLGNANIKGADFRGTYRVATDVIENILARNLPRKSTAPEPQSGQPPPTVDWFWQVMPVGSGLFITAATLLAVIQGLVVVERLWRERNTEITEILLVMDDGSQHDLLRRWISDPDTLQAYIDDFRDPTKKVKPRQVVVRKRVGRALVVDITTGGENNPQSNVIQTYLDLPSNYLSLFISYAHQDESIAKRLHTDLRNKGVPCWFAPHDMKIGDKIHSRIDEAIHVHDKLLLVLSQHSVASAWVEREVEAAFEKEQ